MPATKPKPDRTTDPPPTRSTVDPAKKRIEKARRMVKDAMKAMTTIRARIITLRHEADELERELNAMVEGLGLAIPPVVVEPRYTTEEAILAGAKIISQSPLNGRRVDAVVAPKKFLVPTAEEVTAANKPITLERIKEIAREPLCDLADELTAIDDDEVLEDLRDTPMSVVLAGCSPGLLGRLLSDCTFIGIETIRHLAVWSQAEPGRSFDDFLSRGEDVKPFVAELVAWSRRMNLTPSRVNGLPSAWIGSPLSDDDADEPDDETSIRKHLDEIEAEANSAEDVVRRARANRSKSPALPTELQFKLSEALDPSWKNWAEYRRLTIDDRTLVAVIKARFDDVPKEKRGRAWSVRSGDDPMFWPSAKGYKSSRGALKGQQLCDATRDVMQLGPAPH
jgi:hypothetical protein